MSTLEPSFAVLEHVIGEKSRETLFRFHFDEFFPFRSYCSNIARTFLVNPSEQIQSIYNLLISVEERILTDLKDGAKLNDVYKSAVSLVKKENSELVDKLTKNFGFAMGIEFREASLSIAPNCDAVAKKGKKNFSDFLTEFLIFLSFQAWFSMSIWDSLDSPIKKHRTKKAKMWLYSSVTLS